MVNYIYEHIISSGKNISARIVTLSQSSLRSLFGIFFLLIAFLFGKLAYQKTAFDSLENWKVKNGPSAIMFKKILETKHFFHLADTEALYQKIYRLLPVSLESKGIIWITEDKTIITKAQPESNGQLPLIFVNQSVFNTDKKQFYIQSEELKKLSQKWHQLGGGWLGFESLLQEIEKQKEYQPISIKKQIAVYDSREIRY
ncbi:MAG: hypothetical protein HY072_01525 [Deltaproteobacteria bacterium]|nr:hypothetical protein [Deltaproteobacteria bacterium]